MNTVNDFMNWSKIIFPDRTILRSDLDRMSWEQIRRIGNLEVRSHEENEDGTIILFIQFDRLKLEAEKSASFFVYFSCHQKILIFKN